MSTQCVTVACASGHHIFQLRGDGATLFRQLTETCPQEAAARKSGVHEARGCVGVQIKAQAAKTLLSH